MIPTKDFYHELYRLLETETPLKFNCGRLCGAACCQVSPELPGMYLFPGEEALFEGLAGFTGSEGHLPGYGAVRLLSCEGHCDRVLRPLSCRVFPLAPQRDNNTVTIRMDPRGRAVCPLCMQGTSSLSSGFVTAVGRVFCAILDYPESKLFLLSLSDHLEAFDELL